MSNLLLARRASMMLGCGERAPGRVLLSRATDRLRSWYNQWTLSLGLIIQCIQHHNPTPLTTSNARLSSACRSSSFHQANTLIPHAPSHPQTDQAATGRLLAVGVVGEPTGPPSSSCNPAPAEASSRLISCIISSTPSAPCFSPVRS